MELEMENLKQLKIAYEDINSKARWQLSDYELAHKDVLANSIINSQSRIIEELMKQWIVRFIEYKKGDTCNVVSP